MKAEEFLKQMKNKGHKIPESIHPFRNGRVDISKIQKKQEVISGLLNSGEVLFIDSSSDFLKSQLLVGNLVASAILGKQFISGCWEVRRSRKVISVVESEMISDFNQLLKSKEVIDYDLYESSKFFSGNTDEQEFWSVLKDRNPKICFIVAQELQIKIVEKFISNCRQKGIGVVLVTSQENIKKLVSSDALLSLQSGKEDGKLVATATIGRGLKQEQPEHVLIVDSADELHTKRINNAELEVLLGKKEFGVQDGLNYSEVDKC